MAIIYGYCRISTPTQSIERQERNILEKFPTAHIVKEVFTGTKVEGRNEFLKILNYAKAGDTIVFDSVSRMSRDAEEGIVLYEELCEKGIELIFLKEPHINTEVFKEALKHQIEVNINTGDTATDTFMNTIIEALKKFQIDIVKRQIALAFEQAEKEVQDLRQRTQEGIKTARLNGKQIGAIKGKKLNSKIAIESKKKIVKLSRNFDGTNTDKEVIAIIGIDHKSFYKYKKELLEEMNQQQ